MLSSCNASPQAGLHLSCLTLLCTIETVNRPMRLQYQKIEPILVCWKGLQSLLRLGPASMAATENLRSFVVRLTTVFYFSVMMISGKFNQL